MTFGKMAKCGAKRVDGQPCEAPPIKGMRRCRKHGGKSLVGRASPSYKHGRRSKYAGLLPGRMVQSYEESINDSRGLQLRQEIGLVDARISDLLTRVDTGESGRLWTKLKQTHAEFNKARSLGKIDEMQERLAELGGLIAAGQKDVEIWDEVNRALDLRRKLVESERKRIIETQQSVTAEQITDFMTVLLDILASEVKDRPTLNRLANRLLEIVPSEATSVPVQNQISA